MSKASRKASSTRRGSLRLLQRVWSPFNHLLRATGESVQNVGFTAGRIVKESVGLPRRLGSRISKHSNEAIGNVFRRGGARKAGKTAKKSRKAMKKAKKGGNANAVGASGAGLGGGNAVGASGPGGGARKASRKTAKKSRKMSRRY